MFDGGRGPGRRNFFSSFLSVVVIDDHPPVLISAVMLINGMMARGRGGQLFSGGLLHCAAAAMARRLPWSGGEG